MADGQLSLVLGAVVFAGGGIGLFLQHFLHDSFTTGGPRDMIGAVVGLLTLLSALVLGLLIWTAYGVYSGQNIAVQTLAAKLLQLDHALIDYGPDADPGRAQLRQDLEAIWNSDQGAVQFAARNFADANDDLRRKQDYLQSLTPSTDKQKQALAAAMQTIDSIGQSRLQMSFALSAPISYPLLLIVVGWVVFLFCGFGLMSKGAPMPVVALAIGAVAVASAVLLILDLSNPYLGLIRASPAPLEEALAIMKKE